MEDGEKALAYLKKEDNFKDCKAPDLILLDLNLPRKDGRETLQEIKTNPSLVHIPVVVFTTSDAKSDIMACYNLGCNSYITKPMGLDEFTKTLHSLAHFWFTIVKLSPDSEGSTL